MKKTFTWKDFLPFMKSQEISYLSTINEQDVPETRAMLNLANTANFPKLQKFLKTGTIYFTTNTSSSKMRHIAKNNNASVYFGDNRTFQGLLFTGEIEIVSSKKTKQDFWQDGWTMYYPKGSTDSEYQILKFTAEKYKYYDGKFEVFAGAIALD